VWAGEATAHITRCCEQILIFDLQTLQLRLAHILLALLWQNVVIVAQDEINVILELREESLEAKGKVARWLQRTMYQVLLILVRPTAGKVIAVSDIIVRVCRVFHLDIIVALVF